jgi:hypothetical protein
MGDYDISHNLPGGEIYHGDWYESWHCDQPDTGQAIYNLLGEVGAHRDILLSIHGIPKRGSKGDIEFHPGNHRVYSKFIRFVGLERFIRRNRQTSILDVANELFQEWGWNMVDGVTVAYIPPVEEG